MSALSAVVATVYMAPGGFAGPAERRDRPTFRRKTLRFDIAQDFVRVAGSIDVRVRLPHGSVRADPKADALRVLGVLGLARAVGHPDRARRVTQKREVEVEFLRERAVVVDGIEADAEDVNVLVGVLLNLVAEPATFGRSSGGAGLGIEPQDDVLSLVVGKSNGIAGVVLHLERGSSLSHFNHCGFLTSLRIGCDRFISFLEIVPNDPLSYMDGAKQHASFDVEVEPLG